MRQIQRSGRLLPISVVAASLSFACADGGDTTTASSETEGATTTASSGETASTAATMGTSTVTASTDGTASTTASTDATTATTTATTATSETAGTTATTDPTATTDTTDTGSTGGVPATCDDGVKNQDETAIDCGGGCSPCADGLACYVAADCSAAVCDDLVCGKKIYGTWGLGLIGNKTSYNAFLPAIHGYHFRFSWADWETTDDGFMDSYLLDAITTAVDDGLVVGLMVNVAPTTNGNTPAWLFQDLKVPLVTTTTMQTFPYYFDPVYKTRYAHMLDVLRMKIAAWDPAIQAALLFWQSAEGSTGDEGPYKGDPTNNAYAITDPAWTAFKRDEVWTPLYAAIAKDLGGVRLMVNQGNDGENFQWALDMLPGSWLKAGQFTHYYNFAGEAPYAARLQSLRGSPSDEHRVRGENEGTIANPWWMTSPPQNFFALVSSCLHAGVDIVNVSPANAQSDHAVYEFFNRYAGIRRPEDGNVGFAALREVVDFADTARFPEGDNEFLPLVAPADLQAYTNRVNMIKGSGDPPALQETKLTKLLTQGKMGKPYLNAARIAKIVAAFPDANYTDIAASDVDSYNMDFGVNMIPGNYALWITQVDPNETSVGAFRTGPKSQRFGRFGRRFAAGEGNDRMTFAIDPGLIGDHSYTVRITVTALDDDGDWSLRFWDGAAEATADTVAGGGTGQPIAHTFDIPALVGGGHLGGGDFALQHEGGDDTVFYLVEVERHAQLDD